MRAHDILKGDSTLVYSREKLLELYSPSLSLPKDVDLSLGAIAEEKRAPLAHSPFSEAETRLLSLASINSESNRRGYNNGKKAKPPQASSTVAKKTKESTEDLWDIPTKTTGTFKSDGIFGFSNPPAKVEKNTNISISNAWAALETRDPVGISSLNPVADKDFLSIVNEKTKNLSIQPTSIIPSFQNSMPFNDALQSQSNAFKFVPPKWFYQDPSLLEQGPFTSEQMHNWFKEGYFPPSLPIKCAGDDSFIDLRRFVEKYGSEAPFLVALRDQETLEHEFFMKEASRKNMSSFSHFSQAPSTKLPYSDHRDHTIGYSRPQDQGFLLPTDGYANAHYQQQQLPFMYNRNLGPFIGAESTQFAPAASSTMVGAIQEPISAIGKVEKTFADIPSEIAIQNNVQPDPSSITLPSFQSQNSQNKDKIESGIKQDKFDVAEKKFELNSPEKKPEKEIPVDVKIVKDTQPSPTAKSVAPVAPWAQSKASAAKLTLKDIQEKEQKESEEKRLRKQIESEQKLLAEAHSIAQKKASEVSIVAHSQWGNPSVSTGRKSLVEIMKDEELVKKSGDAPRTSTSSFAKAAAALPTMGATRQPQRIVSQKQDETWQVVGKIEKVSKPITTTAPVPRPNYPISESMNPQPPVQHISSVLQWCRTSLKNAQTKPVTFNVDEFVGMLNTIPISERGTLAMICEDALVGYPSIDPRKFVDVYIKRRKAEIAGIPYNNVNESITASSRKEDDGGWTPVGNKPPLPVDASSQSLPGKSKPTTTKAKKKGKK